MQYCVCSQKGDRLEWHQTSPCLDEMMTMAARMALDGTPMVVGRLERHGGNSSVKKLLDFHSLCENCEEAPGAILLHNDWVCLCCGEKLMDAEAEARYCMERDL